VITRLKAFAIVFCVLFLYVLLGWLFVRLIKTQQGPLKRSVVVLLVLLFLNVLSFGAIWVTLLIAGVATVAQLALSAWRGLHRQGRRSLAHLAAAGVYVLSVVAVAQYIGANSRLAARRADQIISACRAYEAKYGQLPAKLDDLVPAFLPAVPRAMYTVSSADFQYWLSPPDLRAVGPRGRTGVRHTLAYFVVFPLRRLYDFEDGVWRTRD
jgi:hypothetical protein